MVITDIYVETQAADLSKTNNTLANSDLVISLAAGQRVSGFFYLPINIGAVAGGVKWRLNVSSAPTYYVCGFCNNRPVTDTVWQWVLNAQGDMTDPAPSLGLNYITGNFNIVANAAATVTLQFAQNANNALASVLQKGAFLSYFIH